MSRRAASTRRSFLQQTAHSLLALPLASVLPAKLDARASAQTSAAPPPRRAAASPAPAVHLNARDFGAAGDGKTSDTAALQQALDRCAALGGGEVLLSAGGYLTGALQLRSNTTLRLDSAATLLGTADLAEYPVTQVRWEGKWIEGHTALLYAIDAANIAIVGAGKIAGNDALAARPTPAHPLRAPALIEFIRCDGIHLEGFSTQYHRMWSIHPTSSRNIVIRGLTIRSTGGNGDGIDIDSCRHVLIDSCDIATGDDCISLKSGRGAEAFALLATTEDVLITRCTFAGSIFACIGIGSETSGGIRNVRIEHCTFTLAHTFAIYIKTRPGRGAFIEDISASDLTVSRAVGGFLRINGLNSGLRDQDPVPGLTGIPTLRNFRFSNIRVDQVPTLVDATAIDPAKPLDGLTLTNISGTCAKGIFLANIRHAVLRDIHVTGFTGPLVHTVNVTGVGLAGAAALPPTPPPAPIPAPAQPYILH